MTGLALAAVVLALAVAWWSFPGSAPVPEPRPLAVASPPPRGVPVPVNPAEGLERPVAEPVTEEPAVAEAPKDTGAPAVLELVLPVGEGCEGLDENVARLEKLLDDVKTAQGGARKHILRQLGPLMQSVEVDGCGTVPDHRPDVTRVLCDELRDHPEDVELLLVAGFAEVECD